MYALIENDIVIRVYGDIPTVANNQRTLPVEEIIPTYDPRFQTAGAPPSPANAPDGSYVISGNFVNRVWIVEDLPLPQYQATRCDEVDKLWSSKEQGGFIYQDKDFQSDAVSVVRMNTALLATVTPPYWRTTDNQTVTITKSFLQGMIDALTTQGQALFAQAQIHKAAILALTSVEDVAAYDITLGW